MEPLSEPVTPEVKGMEQDGWSNSPAAAHAPDDVYPDVADPEPLKPGFSNAKAVTADSPAAEAKVVDSSQAEDKSVRPAKKAAAKKAAAKKSTAKKG